MKTIRAAIVAGAVALLVAAVPAIAADDPASQAMWVLDGRVDDWVGASTLLGGTWQVSNSELVYQDHIYDDYGAGGGFGAEQRGNVAGQSDGTARYPTSEDRYANNVADLFQLRLATDGEDLWGLVRLNSLRHPDTTVTAIAIDTDGDLTDTSGAWPRDAGVATPGADRIITIWAEADGAGHGEVLDVGSDTTTGFDGVAASAADEDNAYEFRVPLALIGGADWTLWAGTGLWNGDGWMPIDTGAPTENAAGNGNPIAASRLFNVAFREGESGLYFDALQAAALEAGDITRFAATWSPGDADAAYDMRPGSTYAALVEESFSIPPLNEGVSYEGAAGRASGGIAAYEQRFDFFGRWQPYGVYLPETWESSRTWPTLVALHGRGGSHGTFFDFGGGFQRDIGEGHPDDPMVIVSPLGRGRSHYESWGEADVMEVIDDAIARFAVDTDRISLGGYSMGGLGIYRLATLRPDRWASVVAWAGASSEYTGLWATNYSRHTGDPGGVAATVNSTLGTGDGSSVGNGNHMPYGNLVHLVGNLRHLPMLLLTGTNDELLPVTGQVAPYVGLDDLDYRYRVDVFAGYGHLSWGAFDEWSSARDWIGTRSRQTSPRQFAYRYSDSIADPATSVQLGLRYGDAWWVSDLARRDADPAAPEDPYRYGEISVTSRAIPDDEHTAVRRTTPNLSPHPHTRTGLEWVPLGPEPVANALDIDLANLAAATIDVAEARLDPRGLEVDLTTDGHGVVLLRGTFDAPPVVAGPAVVTIGSDGARIEALAAGAIRVSFDA